LDSPIVHPCYFHLHAWSVEYVAGISVCNEACEVAVGSIGDTDLRDGHERSCFIADAGGYGTRSAAETTGPCPQYTRKPPPGPSGVISALGQVLPLPFAVR
jgi:hypothetical protein